MSDPALPEVALYIACSLDGYIATPDGGVDWLTGTGGEDGEGGEDYGYQEFYDSVDALLTGSATYEQVIGWGAWPYPGKPCWVFSSRDLPLERPELVLAKNGPRAALEEIAARGLRRAWLIGGGKLIASFRAEGLITEYLVTIIPVILGGGLPLFPPPGPTEKLRLVESKSYPNGFVLVKYVPTGRPQ